MSEDKLRLGGMALRNGLLVHGPTHWAAAVRTKGGEVKVASGRKPTFAAGFASLSRLSSAPRDVRISSFTPSRARIFWYFSAWLR